MWPWIVGLADPSRPWAMEAGLDRGTLMGIDSEECLTCAPTPEAFNPASGEGHWWCDI